jgi:hypothetical protein
MFFAGINLFSVKSAKINMVVIKISDSIHFADEIIITIIKRWENSYVSREYA